MPPGAIECDAAFQAAHELAKELEQLDVEKFAELMAYLEGPVNRRVRNNNTCGADQPDVPVPGKGAVQVASLPDVGAVRGAEARRGG